MIGRREGGEDWKEGEEREVGRISRRISRIGGEEEHSKKNRIEV